MRLSTRSRYGLSALLDIASQAGDKPVLLKDIARRQEIPAQYLHQLVSPLIKAGILRSVRGAHGGVSLAKPPQEIDLESVIRILEGSIAPVKCVDDPKSCARSDFCVTREVWTEVNEAMTGVLESITLQDLVLRQREKDQLKTAMYYI